MPADEPPAAGESAGVVFQARAFLAACAQYAAARLKLASLEGKEATGQVLKLLLLLAVALIFAVFAWLFLCLGAVFVVARIFGGENAWLWASLAMACAHLVAALVFASVLKSKIKTPLFPLTTEELKKDQQWLETQTKQN